MLFTYRLVNNPIYFYVLHLIKGILFAVPIC